jgi:hypothetical protein
MGFLDNLFGKRPKDTVVLQPRKPSEIAAQRIIEPVNQLPVVVDDYTPDMLSLGWYYSEEKDQLQMAKILTFSPKSVPVVVRVSSNIRR